MIDVIEGLLKGDSRYPAAFRLAKVFWDDFFSKHAHDTEEQLKSAIEDAQIPFQWEVEKAGLVAPLAKSVMAVTCIGSLYNDGFDDPELAKRVVRAMSSSRRLSLGIGGDADEVGKMYDL
jgi:hypothetical protein